MKIIKKNNKKKMPLFPKNVVHFGFFANEMERERNKQGFSNTVIVLNAASVLIFEYKKCQENEFLKIYNWSNLRRKTFSLCS